MEQQKQTDGHDVTYEAVRRISESVFREVLQETQKNLVLVGDGDNSQPNNSFYQPHNFRRYYDFSKKGFNPYFFKKTTQTYVGCINHKVINSTEHFYDNFMNCSVRVRKKTIQITNKNKRWFVIEQSHKSKEQVRKIVETREKECIEVLKNFISLAGGSSNSEIINSDSEDKIQGDKAIDMIPLKMRFRTPIVKKVYKESNIEFSDPVFVAQYLENRAIENISPQIARSIELINPLRVLKQKIKSIQDVINNKNYVKLLTQKEKKEFNRWIFDTIGINPKETSRKIEEFA